MSASSSMRAIRFIAPVELSLRAAAPSLCFVSAGFIVFRLRSVGISRIFP